MRLNKVWQRAIWRDFLIVSDDELNAARIPGLFKKKFELTLTNYLHVWYLPVRVVPILAPRISGKTLSSVNKPILTNGTNALVTTAELWTNIVNPQPN